MGTLMDWSMIKSRNLQHVYTQRKWHWVSVSSQLFSSSVSSQSTKPWWNPAQKITHLQTSVHSHKRHRVFLLCVSSFVSSMSTKRWWKPARKIAQPLAYVPQNKWGVWFCLTGIFFFSFLAIFWMLLSTVLESNQLNFWILLLDCYRKKGMEQNVALSLTRY